MKNIIQKVFTVVILLLIAPCAFGLRQPDGYQQRIIHSKIKAIATVEKVVITDWEAGDQTKKVWFKTIKAFNATTPSEFTGYCMSFKNKWWKKIEPYEGGYIYHYPQKGTTVLVTVESNDSYINSFKTLNDQEKKNLLKSKWAQLKVTPSEVKFAN